MHPADWAGATGACVYYVKGWESRNWDFFWDSLLLGDVNNKKLSYRRGTARCVVSIEILPIATQQYKNYLYDKSWPNRWYEVRELVGGNAW